MTKITLEIKKFIESNCTLTDTALSGLIEKEFNVKVTPRTIDPYLQQARSDAQSRNGAKIEAVRSKILDDADKWANKYLQYTDDEIESLRKLIKESEEGDEPIALETARDRLAASAALHKMLSTIIDFVKPEEKLNVNVNIKPDLKKLSLQQLDQLESIAIQLTGDQAGQSSQESS